jgi:transposase-like protein
MKIRCPRFNCITNIQPGLKSQHVVRNGFFFRNSDSRFIRRFLCRCCGKRFSHSTFSPAYFQKRRRVTRPLYLLLNSGVTQRRAARILKINRKTVIRRFRYLASQERLRHQAWVEETYGKSKLKRVQFDDLETSEQTKCKPLSVSLAVDPSNRNIIHFEVSQMPAKGLLARVSVRKYGYRKDERPVGWNQMMKELVPFVEKDAVWKSDENPHYPTYLKRHHPKAVHETRKGGRGSETTGQGELKRLKFDPLFALNHTCAMLRANLARLARKTWSNTKNRQGLIDHLSIYVTFHNLVLVPRFSLRDQA